MTTGTALTFLRIQRPSSEIINVDIKLSLITLDTKTSSRLVLFFSLHTNISKAAQNVHMFSPKNCLDY